MSIRKLRGVNLFSHIGGMALGLSEWVDTKLYTNSNLNETILLQEKIKNEQLPNGVVHRFSYNVESTELPTNVDIIYAWIHHFQYQVREVSKIDKQGNYIFDTTQTADSVHTTSVREAAFFATKTDAKYILLLFPYNPFYMSDKIPDLPNTIMNIFTSRGYSVVLIKTPCVESINPSERLYALIATKTHQPMIMLSQETWIEETKAFTEVPAPNLPRACEEPIMSDEGKEIVRRGMLLWDISPYMVERIWAYIQAISMNNGTCLHTITDKLKFDVNKLVIDYRNIKQHNLFDFLTQQKIITRLELPTDNCLSPNLEYLMGWPNGWSYCDGDSLVIMDPANPDNTNGSNEDDGIVMDSTFVLV